MLMLGSSDSHKQIDHGGHETGEEGR